jgi:hypothetical protein
MSLSANRIHFAWTCTRRDVPAKGILAELEQYLSGAISQADAKIIKDIAFYFC